jgi:hypothetical protein
MKRILIALLIIVGPSASARAQVCYGGLCYPQQPTAPARLVLPLEAPSPVTNHQSPFPHDAHCRIHVGDGTVGSGTLISKNDATGLVLTCSHLFDGAESNTSAGNIIVAFPNGSRFGARLIDRDPANDLAALLIQPPEAEPLTVDDSEPTGVLTACGYGGNGQFRPASGAVAGAVQAVGATFPSLKIGGAVRPGDSGGGVLNRAGQLVGVVWGCRDGETYLTCGRPLRNFLDRVLPGRQRAGSRSPSRSDDRTPDQTGPEDGPARQPTIDWQAWRDDIDSRLAALDAKKQDRGDYLQAGDLNAYAKKSESQRAVEQVEQSSTNRIESLRTAIHDRIENRIEERIATANPGLTSGLSLGKMLVGALGLSGPVALAVIIAGGLIGRRVKRHTTRVRSKTPGRAGGCIIDPSSNSNSTTSPSAPGSAGGSNSSTHFRPIAVDSPPPPQQTVPESHYVPVERDDFARAHQWAREQVARKYPGATEVLSTLESLIKQQLAGTTN